MPIPLDTAPPRSAADTFVPGGLHSDPNSSPGAADALESAAARIRAEHAALVLELGSARAALTSATWSSPAARSCADAVTTLTSRATRLLDALLTLADRCDRHAATVAHRRAELRAAAAVVGTAASDVVRALP